MRAFVSWWQETTILLRLAFFLAYRQVVRGSIWTNLLITTVMALTFLNLIFIGGILVGLIEGAAGANRALYTGDVLISSQVHRPYIEDTPRILALVGSLPWVRGYSARYSAAGDVEAGYQEKIDYTDISNRTNALMVGIKPQDEARVSGLDARVVEGAYLDSRDVDAILIGAMKLYQYSPLDTPALRTLKGVEVNDMVRVHINGHTKEFRVKGIVKGKVQEVDNRIFMVDSVLREMLGRSDQSVNEIAIVTRDDAGALYVKEALVRSGVEDRALIQTWLDAQPKFIRDMKDTFMILGNIVGTIGLIVASITIFIVIFINAVTRRKYIGILRGIGVSGSVIELSYVIQAFFYAVLGTLAGTLLLFGVIQPWIAAHPINFPFSDGTLSAEWLGTSVRGLLLILASVLAGYVPARMIVRQNTLDAILGR